MRNWPPRGVVYLAAILVLAFVPLGLLIRAKVETNAAYRATQTLVLFSRWLPELPVPDSAEDDVFHLFRRPEEKNETTPSLQVTSDGAKRRLDGPKQRAAPPVGPVPQNVRAPADLVLSWANARMIPKGRSSAVGYGLPAGIELSQVAQLGIGLLDGDRLISVGGIPVQMRAEVVTHVLAARGRREQTIVARLARRTALGVREFTVTIEQPYPDALPTAPGPLEKSSE